MKAFTVQTKGKGGVSDIPEFELKPDYVKIKTVAVALNPSMSYHMDCLASAKYHYSRLEAHYQWS